MNLTLDQLKATAVELPPPERAELAHYLLDSLENDNDVDSAEWHEELERRLADMQAGRVVSQPVEQVLNRLRKAFP